MDEVDGWMDEVWWSAMGQKGSTHALCVKVCAYVRIYAGVCGYDADTGHQSVPGRERDERRLRAKDGRKEEEHCLTNMTYSSAVEREKVRKKNGNQKRFQIF